MLSSELDRLQTIARVVPSHLPRSDARLGSMAVYLLVNGAPRDTVVRRTVLEQITQLTELDSDDRFVDPGETAWNYPLYTLLVDSPLLSKLLHSRQCRIASIIDPNFVFTLSLTTHTYKHNHFHREDNQ